MRATALQAPRLRKEEVLEPIPLQAVVQPIGRRILTHSPCR